MNDPRSKLVLSLQLLMDMRHIQVVRDFPVTNSQIAKLVPRCFDDMTRLGSWFSTTHNQHPNRTIAWLVFHVASVSQTMLAHEITEFQ
ncbi:hypothetical protein BDQ17DRAFT_1363747 [Cyathus striatus]|nr:hypothetical protein BDQ17DRAFT_1363747 [Cyathus striatus]